MRRILAILLLISSNVGFGQLIGFEQKEITPRNVYEIGGVYTFDSVLYLMLSGNIRYEGKDIEASEAKVISQKYRIWDLFRLDETNGELVNMNKKWRLENASPNGFCFIDDSTVVYTNKKSQLISTGTAFNVLLQKVSNTDYHFSDPTWDKYHKRLYFSSDLPGGKGGMDFWYIETEGPYAGVPVNAGTINGPNNELSLTIANDTMVYFVSNPDRQAYEIFIYQGISATTRLLEPMPGSNEFFTSAPNANTLYFVKSSDKKQSLWKGQVIIRPIENVQSIVPAVVEELPVEEPKAEPEEVMTQSTLYDDPDFRSDNYFGVAKFTLTPEMKDSLNKIATLLEQNPTLNIVICGHSSPDGPEDKNMLLSSFRANEAYKWLLEKGINMARIHRIYGGEYLYANVMHSRMFSVFTVTDTEELPRDMVAVPSQAIGNPDQVYASFGTDSDEVEYWRYILKKQLPVEDKKMLLLPIKNIHYVLKGETLYSLARWYGSTVDKMIKANGLKDATISTGKILYVPAD